jgi:hypothetical protein
VLHSSQLSDGLVTPRNQISPHYIITPTVDRRGLVSLFIFFLIFFLAFIGFFLVSLLSGVCYIRSTRRINILNEFVYQMILVI